MVNPGNVYSWARKNMKKSEVDTYRSDLYVKVTDKSRYMVNELWDKNYSRPGVFKSQIDGQYWYEFPLSAMGEFVKREERKKKKAVRDRTNTAGIPYSALEIRRLG